ncbi:MAG: outer membrane lipoprotein-sorting protein [bacterium]
MIFFTRTLIVLFVSIFRLFSMTGEQILEAMDKNRDYKTLTFSATMQIQSGKRVRIKNMVVKGIINGNRSIVKFTNPEDRGTKFMMTDNSLWIYFPEEDETIKISGHMLKKGMMGSDLSYEDALKSDKLKEKYEITLSGEENFKGNDCYLIALEAKVKDVPYYKRKMWVEKKSFVAWKEEMYSKSGKLLKVSEVLEVKLLGLRYFPVKSQLKNVLKKDSKTLFEMSDIKIDIPLSEDIFSWRYLKKW